MSDENEMKQRSLMSFLKLQSAADPDRAEELQQTMLGVIRNDPRFEGVKMSDACIAFACFMSNFAQGFSDPKQFLANMVNALHHIELVRAQKTAAGDFGQTIGEAMGGIPSTSTPTKH